MTMASGSVTRFASVTLADCGSESGSVMGARVLELRHM
jgi:hypothetical protein